MKLALLTLALFFVCGLRAIAAPALAQAAVCGSGTGLISFASAPANGTLVVGVESGAANSSATPSLLDSNSLAYPRQVRTATASADSAIYSGVVSGTPGAQFTFPLNSGVTEAYCIYNLTGTSSTGTFTSAANAASGATLVGTIPGVASTDFLVATAFAATGTGTSLVISNGTSTADQNSGGFFLSSHSFATSTASSTATLNISVSDSVSLVFGDYTASAGSPAPYFGAPGMTGYRGDPIFERMLTSV